MQAQHRLRENRDFRRVFQRGKSVATGRLVMYWSENRLGTFRVGFSISKKVGNAVTRNRLKRLLRECFRRYGEKLAHAGVDLVVIVRPTASGMTFADAEAEVLLLLKRAKFVV
ncbi:MAG: ribonuclease P protein component [Alicyclobacillaceae bacterium]|nr:ribonuclease P protein component [Alicyclobacillaceae bacterium]